MFLHELPEHYNIIDSILPTSVFDDESVLLFIESAMEFLYEYVNEHPESVSEPDFKEEILQELTEYLCLLFENHLIYDEDLVDEIEFYVDAAWDLFSISIFPERSLSQDENENTEEVDYEFLDKQIDYLRTVPQPAQRTNEWYTFRHKLITASSAYKAFESQCMQNQLIYEKCQPLRMNTEDDAQVGPNKIQNLTSPLHWGQKYEPISVLLYEEMYNTKVEDFGCIPHSSYNFLGASPDGIVVDKNSERYGRMLEIKNVVNREITGIPKKEYWIQMQLQMEVCNLDKCDFLETKFLEYPDENSFSNEQEDVKRGIILYFNTKENVAFYVYKPLDILSSDDIDAWIEQQLVQHEKNGMLWIRNIYWKLEKLSCVLVLRNKTWFQNNVKQLEYIWSIILRERVTGCSHRAPNKKSAINQSFDKTSEGCLLKIHTEKFFK